MGANAVSIATRVYAKSAAVNSGAEKFDESVVNYFGNEVGQQRGPRKHEGRAKHGDSVDSTQRENGEPHGALWKDIHQQKKKGDDGE
eukprot:650590-Rhodomonas_salina.1